MQGYITEQQFEKLEKFDPGHPKIRTLGNGHLLKRIPESQVKHVRDLSKKRVKNLILPEKIYKVVNSQDIDKSYAYKMIKEKGFTDLTDFYCYEDEYDSKSILLFFKSLLESVQNMHKSGVASGDLWCGNILLNEGLDHRLIDFDIDYQEILEQYGRNCSIPLFLEHYDECVLNSQLSYFDQIKLSDKMYLWNMILHCMYDSYFKRERFLEPITNLDKWEMPKNVQEQLEKYMQCQELPEKDDYFLEELDTLIKKNYVLPYRKN